MQILLFILSLVLLIYLCFKGVPIFFGAMISGIFLLVTAGMNPVEQITTTYVTGLANYFGKFFFIFGCPGNHIGFFVVVSDQRDYFFIHSILRKSDVAFNNAEKRRY